MYSYLYQNVAPPVQGQIFKLTHSTTAARYETPPQWKGANVTIVSTDSGLDIAFGDGGVKIAAADRAVVLGETLSANWASGLTVPAGVAISVPVPQDATHFSCVSLGTSGTWTAFVSSGNPSAGEDMPLKEAPLLWLDFGKYSTLSLATADIASVRCRAHGYEFTEASNRPALTDAATVGADLTRAAASFTAGNSDKLVCTDATLAASLGSSNAFTLVIAARRGAAGANHTLFSVGTAGSANGRWDFTLNSSDDPIMTRVDSAGASTTSAVAASIASGEMNLYTWTFDGTTPLYWQDRTATALTGTATGDVGTTTKVAVGCRAYNTSTADQFATAEIPEVLVWGRVLSTPELDAVHAWLKRRYGQ